jgi:hypothetical protein
MNIMRLAAYLIAGLLLGSLPLLVAPLIAQLMR